MVYTPIIELAEPLAGLSHRRPGRDGLAWLSSFGDFLESIVYCLKMKSFCETLISKPNAKEARNWLQSGRKRGFTLGVLGSTEESLALVEKAYAAGAVRVTAVEIDVYPDMGGCQNTGKLVIELPDAPSKRARVLAWGSKIAEEQGFDPLSDTGERYFFIMLD